MNSNAAYHALLIFIGVIGAAAIFFSVMIWRAYQALPYDPTDKYSFAKSNIHGDVTGIIAFVPVAAWIALIAWLW